MNKLVLFGLLLAGLIGASITASPSTARAEGIEVRSQAAQNRFPDGITFTLFTASNANITTVRLRFRVLPDGPVSFARPQCNTGTNVQCTATIGSTASNYMVPGAEVQYAWEIDDAAGQRLDTDMASTTYEDRRFQWESIREGNLTVYYYFGDATSNGAVLRTARETINAISTLEGTTVDFPVKIWVYQTVRDLQPAVASSRTLGPSSTVSTLGEVGASDTALVARDTDFLNIVRHELAHIVTGAATRGHIAELPVWVNEGISTHAQRELLPDEKAALDIAVRRNTVLPITSLSATARGTAGTVSLFYGQSGAIVKFMVETYGAEKFAQFIAAFKNETTNGALNQVYGLDQLGLENAWRKSVGLSAINPAESGNTGGASSAPTFTPFGSSQGSGSGATPAAGGEAGASTSTQDDGGGSSALPIIGGIAGAIVLLGAGSLFVMRRRSKMIGPS